MCVDKNKEQMVLSENTDDLKQKMMMLISFKSVVSLGCSFKLEYPEKGIPSTVCVIWIWRARWKQKLGTESGRIAVPELLVQTFLQHVLFMFNAYDYAMKALHVVL